MKELLLQMAGYNAWANKQFIDTILKLDIEVWDMEIPSSFPSIRGTVYHMWSAEDIWLQRLNLVERPLWAESVFDGSFAGAMERWQNVSKELGAFVERQYDDAAFRHVLQYYNLKKVSFKLPVYAVLMQTFNHATYHRGQLTTMLRQVGVKKLPGTDFHSFVTK